MQQCCRDLLRLDPTERLSASTEFACHPVTMLWKARIFRHGMNGFPIVKVGWKEKELYYPDVAIQTISELTKKQTSTHQGGQMRLISQELG